MRIPHRTGAFAVIALGFALAAATRAARPRPAAEAAGIGGPLFVDSGQSLGNDNSTGMALGDLDGDGDPDAFVVTSASDAHRVWVNQGGQQGGTPGVYLDSGQQLGAWPGTEVALGDVDGDGDLDAFVAHDLLVPDRIWLNDGEGVFFDSDQTLGATSSLSVALGDLDADGDLDAVVGSTAGAQVWLNLGGAQGGSEGTYQPFGPVLGSCSVLAVALGRLDANSTLDAYLGCGSTTAGAPDRVFIGNGTGGFFDSKQLLGSTRTFDATLFDADGDGDLDVWAGTGGQPSQDRGDRLWVNQGGAQGGQAGVFLGTGATFDADDTRGAATGDFDADGDLDVFTTNFSGIDRVWLNQGGGVFVDSGDDYGFDISSEVAIGDVDGDGTLDAWVAAFGADHVWLGTVQAAETLGFFRAPETLDAGTGVFYETVVATDLDSDLDADLVFGPTSGDDVLTLINQGGLQGGTPGTFLAGPTTPDFPSTRDFLFTLADFDGDGDPDLFFLADEFSDDPGDRVLFNQGGAQGGEPGSFVDGGQRLGTRNGAEAIAVDVERDGDFDVVVRNGSLASGLEPTDLWLNQGGAQGGTPGVFVASPQDLGTSRITALSPQTRLGAGDLDGDGDFDLVLGVDTGLGTYLNQGGVQGGVEGVFTPTGQVLRYAEWHFQATTLGDFDDDGDLDLVAAPDAGAVLFLNDGAGGWTPPARCVSASENASDSLLAADADLDGALDLLTAGYVDFADPRIVEGTATPTLAVYFGDGAGGLDFNNQCIEEREPGPAPYNPERLASLDAADFDLDGDPDLVGLYSRGIPREFTRVVLFRNGGPPGFERCCAIQFAVLDGRRYWHPVQESCEGQPPSRGAAPSLGEDVDGLVDLGAYARLRSPWLPERSGGGWVTEFYAEHELEVTLLLATDPALFGEALDALRLWEDDVGLLVAGQGGQEIVSQLEVDAIESFLATLQADGSPELAQAIADRLDALPPLQTLVGLPLDDAAVLVVGVWVPYFADGFESGNTAAWSATVP